MCVGDLRNLVTAADRASSLLDFSSEASLILMIFNNLMSPWLQTVKCLVTTLSCEWFWPGSDTRESTSSLDFCRLLVTCLPSFTIRFRRYFKFSLRFNAFFFAFLGRLTASLKILVFSVLNGFLSSKNSFPILLIVSILALTSWLRIYPDATVVIPCLLDGLSLSQVFTVSRKVFENFPNSTSTLSSIRCVNATCLLSCGTLWYMGFKHIISGKSSVFRNCLGSFLGCVVTHFFLF